MFWSAHTGSDCASNGLANGYGMCYAGGAGGVLVVVGQPVINAVMISSNGTHFTPKTATGAGRLRSCAYSAKFSRIIAVGENFGVNTMMISPDMGESWTGLGSPLGIGCFSRIIWVFDKFIAAGSNNSQIGWSSNGLTWNNGTISNPLGTLCASGMRECFCCSSLFFSNAFFSPCSIGSFCAACWGQQ
jgi:hypothetical protein